MSFSTQYSFSLLNPPNNTTTGVYELAQVNVNGASLPADFVRVWASVTASASLNIYYADDITGQGEINESYTLSPNTAISINSFLKKPYVKITITNNSADNNTVTVRTKYDRRPVPSVELPTFVNTITDNLTAKVETSNNIAITSGPFTFTDSSIVSYGATGYVEANLKGLLTDASGRTILVTKDDKLSITGPVEITGPISITGPVSITGQMLIQTSPQTAVTISGNMNCNINAGQYVMVENPVIISGDIQCTFQPGQLISISGPVDISSSTVNMSGATVNDVPNVTLQSPISVNGPINGNINQSQNQVNVSGAAYTTLTDISANLSYISNALFINNDSLVVNNIFSPEGDVVLTSWMQTLSVDITITFGINCILCYSDNTIGEGDIAILCSTNNIDWEYIGIIEPTVAYNARSAATKINVAPFKYIRIQNLSNINRTNAKCTLLDCKALGVP